MNKQKERMEEVVDSFLQRHGVLDGQHLLLAAFSGGEDSMTLLHLLRNREVEPLVAAYIHHGLRTAADEEERQLRALCEAWSIPFFCTHVNVEQRVKEKKETVEEAARLLRYQALEAIGVQEAERRGLQDYYILTAHHADDQAETILLNIIRGTSLTGLTGMKEKSGHLLRPLLEVTRSEIHSYVQQHGLFHVEDESNWETTYRRNQIRLELIPNLRKMNPRITEALNKMGRILREDEAYLEEQAESAWETCRTEDPKQCGQTALWAVKTAQLPSAIRFRVLRHFLQVEGGLRDISEAQLTILDHFLQASDGKQIDLTGRQIQMEKGMLVRREKKPLPRTKVEGYSLGQHTRKSNADADTENRQTEIFIGSDDLGRWIETPWGQLRLSLQDNPGNRIREFSLESYTKWFSCDIITENLCLRNRKTGDFLSLRSGRQSLQDRMVNQKIPKAMRDQIPLLVQEQECIWIIGDRSNERFWVSPEDPKAIRAEWIPKSEEESEDKG